MNNQELKELIIKFAKSLEVSELECIDNALCDAFKAQLNMQQPETILNHVHELEDKIKSLEEQLEAAQNKEPEIKEVEKVVEKEVIKEVIPTAVQEELDSFKNKNEELESKIQELEEVNDDLNDQIKELENDLNDSMNIAATALDDVETLKVRCTELHEQNEYLLSKLEEPEEVEFEEVSNEDILANSIDDEDDDEFEEVEEETFLDSSNVQEEEILKQMTESLDQLVDDEEEKK